MVAHCNRFTRKGRTKINRVWLRLVVLHEFFDDSCSILIASYYDILIWMIVWVSDLNRFVLNLVPQHSTSSMLIETDHGSERWEACDSWRAGTEKDWKGDWLERDVQRKHRGALALTVWGSFTLLALGISNQWHKRSDWANSCQCDRIWYYSPFYNHCTLLIYRDELSQNPCFKPDTLLHQCRRASGTAPWLSEACVQ